MLTGLDLISLLSPYNKSTSVWQEVEVRNPNVKTWSRAECETWRTGFFNQTQTQRLTAHNLSLFNACRKSGTHTRMSGITVSDRNRRNITASKISTLTGQLWRALQNVSSSFHWALKMHFTRLHSLRASRLTARPADTHHIQHFLHLTWHTNPLRTEMLNSASQKWPSGPQLLSSGTKEAPRAAGGGGVGRRTANHGRLWPRRHSSPNPNEALRPGVSNSRPRGPVSCRFQISPWINTPESND